MAMSRTARILIAILLLAAAAFFWVNFYTQNRAADTPAVDPVAAGGGTPAPTPEPAAAEGADAEAATAADDGAATAAEAAEATVAPTEAEATDAATDADAAAEAGAEEPTADAAEPEPVVVAPTVAPTAPPTVVVDAPVAVGREIVVADLPFLVTEPRPVAAADVALPEAETAAPQGVTVPTRATVNPFSPVVVRTPPAPERDVPLAGDGAIIEVAVPAGPTAAEAAAAAAPVVRAAAPTPRAVAPRDDVGTTALRPLPTGSVLAATPQLLQEPRAGRVAEEVDFPTVAAITVPDAEPSVLEPGRSDAAPAGDVAEVAPLDRPAQGEPVADADPPADAPETNGAAANGAAGATPPLAAGATQLARYLRDRNYAFTGSVVGPISVGVFRSDLDRAPVVVALGQNLPDTDIVLTDLRGQQAELRLGDSTQILTLDLRR